MQEAKVKSPEIDCISSHGTATNFNDEMEAQAFNRVALETIPVFSLKAIYGHTLGAAGLLETVISLNFADKNLIPRSEEHTSELQSRPHLVCRLLLEKKK